MHIVAYFVTCFKINMRFGFFLLQFVVFIEQLETKITYARTGATVAHAQLIIKLLITKKLQLFCYLTHPVSL